jgi:FixJ family two-component response regulator
MARRRQASSFAFTVKFKRLRIAVVDDEAHVRKALERLMRGVGFDVRTYACCTEFLATVAEEAPDCLVLDLHMPGQSGFDLQDAMRDRGLRIPMVVITGHDSGTAKGQAMAGGAYAYLRKPVDGPELVAAITSAVAAANP